MARSPEKKKIIKSLQEDLLLELGERDLSDLTTKEILSALLQLVRLEEKPSPKPSGVAVFEGTDDPLDWDLLKKNLKPARD